MKNKKFLKWLLIIIISIVFIGFAIESGGWHTIGNIRILDTLNGSLYTRSIRSDSLNIKEKTTISTYNTIDINGIRTNNLALSDYVALSSAGVNIINTTPNNGFIDFVNGTQTTASIDSINGINSIGYKLSDNRKDIESRLRTGEGIFFLYNQKLVFAYKDNPGINYYYIDLTSQANQQWNFSQSKP